MARCLYSFIPSPPSFFYSLSKCTSIANGCWHIVRCCWYNGEPGGSGPNLMEFIVKSDKVLLLLFYLLFWEKEREKQWFVFPLIYAFIGWFLYVPWLGIEPPKLMYWDDTLANWATQPQAVQVLLRFFSPQTWFQVDLQPSVRQNLWDLIYRHLPGPVEERWLRFKDTSTGICAKRSLESARNCVLAVGKYSL